MLHELFVVDASVKGLGGRGGECGALSAAAMDSALCLIVHRFIVFSF